MNKDTNNTSIKAVVEQVTNNTTSWIGHQKFDNKDIIGGQTFTSPTEMDIDAIEVLTSIVTTPGRVLMTIHPYDSQTNTWGPPLRSASLDLDKNDNGKWKSFHISGLHLNKGKTYGFQLESPNSYIGMGEAAGSSLAPPLPSGKEWQFIKNDNEGHSFSYFSLAFRVEARA